MASSANPGFRARGAPVSPRTGDAARDERDADLELVRRARAGDSQAVERFVQRMRCIPRLLAAKNARTGHALGPEDLADLAQETFSAVWNKAGEFRGEARLETWVARFCLHLYMNALRRAARGPRALEDEEPPDGAGEPAPATDEPGRLLHAALARLPKSQLRVVRMRAYDRLPFDEIAQRAGLPVGTAKTYYYRGLERLRALLRPAFEQGLL